MKKIGFVSLNSGGTMGHMSLLTNLADKISEKMGCKFFIFSEYDYTKSSNLKNKNLEFVEIKKQEHHKTIAGCLKYKYKDELISIIEKEKFHTLIFSTFFDPNILKYFRRRDIKTILVSYPLRDSHRVAFKIRKYYKYFDKIFTLKDLIGVKPKFPNEEIVSPIFTPLKKNKDRLIKGIKNILITCGGGGRPSAELFFNKIQKVIPQVIQENQSIHFTLIRGNYNGNLVNLPNSEVTDWSNDFLNTLKNYDLVISEAGYFTVLDLLLTKKPAILIPGERRIDNQELRALKLQDKHCGICVFPTENTKSFVNELNKIINYPSILLWFSKNLEKECDNIFSYKKLDEAILEEIK